MQPHQAAFVLLWLLCSSSVTVFAQDGNSRWGARNSDFSLTSDVNLFRNQIAFEESSDEWSTSFTLVVILCLGCVLTISGVAVLQHLRNKSENSENTVLTPAPKVDSEPKKLSKDSNPTPSVPQQSFLAKLIASFGGSKKGQSDVAKEVEKMEKLKKYPKFIADYFLRSEFDPSIHRRYHAATYFQSNTLLPMKDADRTNTGKLAFQDFTNGLADISQREPLESEHIGGGVEGKSKEEIAKLARQAQWERLIQDRYATDCTYRYKERLKRRTKAYYRIKQRNTPVTPEDYRWGVPIRRDTMKLLTQSPEIGNDPSMVASYALNLLLYLYGLFGQARSVWSLPSSNSVAVSILGFEVSNNTLIWIYFLSKESMFIALPTFVALAATMMWAYFLMLAPFVFAYYAVAIHGREQEVKKYLRLWRETIKPILFDQFKLITALFKSLSTTRTCLKIFQQLKERECNPSFNDFDILLQDLSNIMFTVVILVGADHGGHEVAVDKVFSLTISLFLLLKNFVAQRMRLRQIYHSLKDINENRLSKFELALLLFKYNEIMLSSDVQCNFVQHFYSGPEDPLDPVVEPLPDEDPDEVMARMPALPEALAKEFGHDMLGEYRNYAGPAMPYHANLPR